MEFFAGLNQVPADFGPSAVTIGKFDGVHIGHRRVLSELRAQAAERGLVATAVTFDRNPLSLIAPEKCPAALVSNAQKVELLAGTGIDATVMVVFDAAFSELSPREFVRSVLVDALHARRVLAGHDFRFGAKGEGDLGMLQQLGAEFGFEVVVIDDVLLADAPLADAEHSAGRRASSTWIRELLDTGHVREATALLGRAPRIRSTVVHGEQRGRVLGYPTANLDPELEGFLPVDGVYATWAYVDGRRFGAATSIGNNPTFDGIPARQVESHLFDQSLDLYGKPIELEFVEYLRPMNRFVSVEALVAQLHADDVVIRGILAQEPPEA